MTKRILCTGGAGYIGSHTTLRLLEAGFEVVVLDNFCNSSRAVVPRLEQITSKKIPVYEVDVRDPQGVRKVFREQKIDGVIHYAAYKNVGESVANPLMYYSNNMHGLLNLLEVMEEHKCRLLVFSSSCTVYRPLDGVLLKEDGELGPTCPYGRSKLWGEDILRDLYATEQQWRIAILRYFNPIGAHPSGQVGEQAIAPLNLQSVMQLVAQGKMDEIKIFGGDYPTPDGTGVRDYVHVDDVAEGHVAALANLIAADGGKIDVFNLGRGEGVSVREMIEAFQKASSLKLPFRVMDRRAGDAASVSADVSKAKEVLGWTAKRNIQDACESSWKWLSDNKSGYVCQETSN